MARRRRMGPKARALYGARCNLARAMAVARELAAIMARGAPEQPERPHLAGPSSVIRSTAWHEAGHAVAESVLHFPQSVQFALVCADKPRDSDQLNGFVRRHGWDLMWHTVSDEAVMSYAGVAAQAYADEHEEPGIAEDADAWDGHVSKWIWGTDAPDEDCVTMWAASSHDREGLESFARERGEDMPADCWHAPSWHAARALLAEHFEALARVAAELCTVGWIEGFAVAAIVQECHGRPLPIRGDLPAEMAEYMQKAADERAARLAEHGALFWLERSRESNRLERWREERRDDDRR